MSTGNTVGRGFYLPSLDGIRAIAAVMVFASHAGLGHIIPGGFGVTVFFFLSGYLITTLMRREFEQTGGLDFKAFYLRRAYRILPPLYVVLGLIVVVNAIIGFDHPISLANLASLILQYSNYYLLAVGHDDILPSSGSFWSLAVEEHFYLVFPLVFLLTSRHWSRAGVARFFIATCLLVLAWRYLLILGMGAPGERTYLATDTRIDSMLFGCIMGVWMNPALDADPFRHTWQKLCALAIGLGLLLSTFVIRDEMFRSTLRYTVQGIGLFPLFWLAVRHADWLIFRPLNTATARLLGALSYSFYLNHLLWLGVGFRIFGGGGVASSLFGLVLTMICSYIVYKMVEIPFGRLRHRLHQQTGKKGTAANRKDDTRVA
jgi:peptidoglycan/LPS O-acetylase OafA/YrhL